MIIVKGFIKMKKTFLGILASCAVLFASCAYESDRKPCSVSFFAMDTYMTVTAYGKNAESALNDVSEKIIALEKMWSATDENSEVYAINNSGGKTVPVSKETEALIEYALEISEATDGALNITLYPVLKAWGFTTGEYRVPSDDEIAALLENTGCEKVRLDSGSVTIPEGMQLDLGAVGKGYAGDIAVSILKERGVNSALLDLGGNIQAIGSKPDGTPWRVGLRNPFDGGSLAMLEVSDCAVITSGGYERYFTDENGSTYCHILDPENGRPAESGLASATIIGSKGRLCDGLSTAVFVMGQEKAEQFWRGYGGFEMVLVTKGGEVYITEGIEESFTLNGEYPDTRVNVIR